MMKSIPTLSVLPRWRHLWLRAALFGCGLHAFAQTGAADASQERSAAAAQEPVVMAPFEVSSSDDSGYRASSSLAGSRLNTALRDTAATISVMTPEFISDLGAVDLTEALAYGNNVQENIGDQVAGNDAGNPDVEFFTTYRVRGIQASVARNYFTWNLPSDLYNVERIDESRGPNSILFGIGSAGGIINTSTKLARTNRTSTQVAGIYSSHDSWRETLDHNQVVIPDKLAFRFNAVHDDAHTFRLFTGTKKTIASLAGTWRASPATTVKLEYEKGKIDAVITRPWGLIDRVSLWENAGRPITSAINAANGVGTTGTGRHVTYVDQANGVTDYRNTRITAIAGEQGQVMLFDYPSSINPEGPGATTHTQFKDYTLTLEQKLAAHTFGQVIYNHQDYQFTGYDAQNGAHFLYADPNPTIGGVANPYAGQYFLETNWYRRNRKERYDTLRATLSTEFDFGRAGRHRLAFMAERQKSNYWRDEKREYWAGAPFNATPENANNLVYRRTYINLSDPASIHVSGGDGQLINGAAYGSGTLSSTWIQRNTNTNDDTSRLRTFLLGDQSYFFDNRLVLTAGYRRDRVVVDSPGTTRDPATQEIVIDHGNVSHYTATGNTRTLGGVGHLGHGVSLFYNNSNSINLPDSAHRVLPDSGRAPTWKGTGEDYGAMLELFNGKLTARLTRFATASRGETDFYNIINIVTNRNNRVLSALEASGAITAADVAARTVDVNTGTADRDSSGYELSVVANPTNRWRWLLNYSRDKSVASHSIPEVLAWARDSIAYWQQFDQNLVTTGSTTLADEIVNLQTSLANITSVDGQSLVGNRRDSLSLFTRYDLGGALDGFYVGGGFNYKSGSVMGTDVNNRIQYSAPFRQADFLLGYRRRLAKSKAEFSVQLNVTNLFDDHEPIIYRLTSDNLYPTRAQLRDGRAYRVSVSLKF